MNLSDIALHRLVSQQLISTNLTSPKEVVSWMGAMQAQDYPMARWAIGVRLPDASDQDIERAIAEAQIIRSHMLRPTWHFTAAEDIYWLLDLTAGQVKAAMSYRERALELTEEIFSRSNAVIEKALMGGRQLTREELIDKLNQAGIATDQNRASHLFARAELEQIMCSGATRKGKTTYALLPERVKTPRRLTREEALAELARRYFTSRGPATLQDFTWWSGLPAREASLALEMVKSGLTGETMDERTYWLPADGPITPGARHSVLLLPTYDEFLISYTNRGATIAAELESHMKDISDRGVFRPILVVDGQLVGIWKRTLQKDTLLVQIQPFVDMAADTVARIRQAASRFAEFSGKKLELTI